MVQSRVRNRSNFYLKFGATLRYAELTDRHPRFEAGVANEVNRMLEEVGLPPVASVPNVNAAKNRRPYREYYSPALRDDVFERFHYDFGRFDYAF